MRSVGGTQNAYFLERRYFKLLLLRPRIPPATQATKSIVLQHKFGFPPATFFARSDCLSFFLKAISSMWFQLKVN